MAGTESNMDRATALQRAARILSRSEFTQDPSMTGNDAQLAIAWLMLAEAVRPEPPVLRIGQREVEEVHDSLTKTVGAIMDKHEDLQRRFTELQNKLRTLADDFQNRARITGDVMWQDAAYLILITVDDGQTTD